MQYVFSDKIANLRPSAIREILKAPSDANTISFAAGNPSPESFPVRDLARLAADLFAQESTTALQYGVTEGSGARSPNASGKSSGSADRAPPGTPSVTKLSLFRAVSRQSSLPARFSATKAIRLSARSLPLWARSMPSAPAGRAR